MSQQEDGEKKRNVPAEAECFLLHGPLTEAESKEHERQKYQRERDSRDDAYRDRQLEINAGQLEANRRIALYTLVLAILSILGLGISFLSSQAAKESADAAKSAADTASKSLAEITKGGTDTHDLASAAKQQADNTKDLAQRALAQLTIGNKMAGEAKRSGDLAKNALDQAKNQMRVSVRPWVGLTDQGNAVATDPITFDKDGNASIHYSVTVRNFSSAAAKNIMPYARLLVTEDLAELWTELEETCGEGYIGKRDMGLVLFSGRESLIQQSGGFYRKERMKSPSYNGKFEGWLVGCIGYRDQFDHLYRSKFIYWLNDPLTRRPKEFDAIPNATVEGVFLPWYTTQE